ncbi:MAG: DUF2625 family protein [Erysipelotrichaceae bacterium]
MNIEWREIEQFFEKSTNRIKLKRFNNEDKSIIKTLKINEQSVLGQVLLNVSGVVINDYLRIWGNDEPNILFQNDRVKQFYSGNKLIVANDIWGGMFAISNGDFEGNVRSIWYFAPDLLEWENLDINYADFLLWACGSGLEEFYQSFLWKDSDSMFREVNLNQAILIYPFLWAEECNLETAEKKIVPFEELISINADYQNKLT